MQLSQLARNAYIWLLVYQQVCTQLRPGVASGANLCAKASNASRRSLASFPSSRSRSSLSSRSPPQTLTRSWEAEAAQCKVRCAATGNPECSRAPTTAWLLWVQCWIVVLPRACFQISGAARSIQTPHAHEWKRVSVLFEGGSI